MTTMAIAEHAPRHRCGRVHDLHPDHGGRGERQHRASPAQSATCPERGHPHGDPGGRLPRFVGWSGDAIGTTNHDARDRRWTPTRASRRPSLPKTYTITASAGRAARSTRRGGGREPCGAEPAFAIAADACYTDRGRAGGRRLGGRGGELHVHERARRTTRSRRASRSRPTRSRRRPGAGGTIDPSGAVIVDCGAEPGVHDRAGRRLRHRGRAGGRRFGGPGGELHVHQRAGEPHDRRQLRAGHLHDHGLGRGRRHDRPERRGGRRLRRRPGLHDHAGRRLPHRGRAGGRQSRWARWRATRSPTCRRTTRSPPASRWPPTRSRPRPAPAARSTRAARWR